MRGWRVKSFSMFRSYQLRLRPRKEQREMLIRALSLSCDLYNAALQERRDAWNIEQKRISYIDQQSQLTELRQEDSVIRSISADVLREPLRRVDRAFANFFRRCKTGEKPGYPRFRSKSRYDSLVFNLPRLKNGMLMMPNLGGLKFKTKQIIQGAPRTATIKRVGSKWVARITCDIGPAPEKRAVSTAVGVDVGLINFATLSDGTVIENPRWTRRFEERIAAANQTLALKAKRSNNRRRAIEVLRAAHRRAANSRRNFTHHVSKWLVKNYDLIAYEKLNIKGMVRGNLAKSILDAAWGELIWQTTYKAESAGAWSVPVNPRRTTIECSACGEPVHKGLSERTHRCPACGLVLCRDQNAARNILRLGESLAGISLQNVCTVN
jgi:putative transposase